MAVDVKKIYQLTASGGTLWGFSINALSEPLPARDRRCPAIDRERLEKITDNT
jgi:hypothetical protein